MSADLSHSGTSGNFTWGHLTIYGSGSNGGVNSLLIGNDVTIGDCNIGGIMGMKSTGSNCGFRFFNSSGTDIGTLQSTGGTLQFNGQTIIHSGNISSQTVNYANSAGNADTAGSATRSRYLTCPDTRSTMPAPTEYTATTTGVSFDFKQSSVTGLSGYTGVMTFRPYSSSSDWTGGAAHQLGFCGGDNRLYHRTGTSSWSSTWNKLAYTSDIPSTISWSNVTGKPFLSNNHWSGVFYINSNGNDAYIGSANSSWFHFQNSADIPFYFSNDVYGNGQFYLYSDRTKKKDIKKPSRTSLERLYEVSDKLLKKYILKSSGEESYGYIAQELEQYIPEAVTHGPDGSRTVSYNVANSVIIAALVQKVKELEDIIKNGRN